MLGAYANLSLIEIWVNRHGRQFKCIKDCTQMRNLICHSLWLWQTSCFWPFIEININLSVSPFQKSSEEGREWHSVAMNGPEKAEDMPTEDGSFFIRIIYRLLIFHIADFIQET